MENKKIDNPMKDKMNNMVNNIKKIVTSMYTEKEIEDLCKKYNLKNYKISYIGCSFECPFHCPEPDICVADKVLKNPNA